MLAPALWCRCRGSRRSLGLPSPTVRVSIVVPAEPAVVWADLRHIARHVDWMSDASSIRFLSEATEGVGVRFECATRVGPIRLIDRMEVTEWRDGQSIGIHHRGVVSGTGRFALTPLRGSGGETHTQFEWTETLQFPWWMGGAVGAVLARRVLRAVWSRNLSRFAARF